MVTLFKVYVTRQINFLVCLWCLLQSHCRLWHLQHHSILAPWTRDTQVIKNLQEKIKVTILMIQV